MKMTSREEDKGGRRHHGAGAEGRSSRNDREDHYSSHRQRTSDTKLSGSRHREHKRGRSRDEDHFSREKDKVKYSSDGRERDIGADWRQNRYSQRTLDHSHDRNSNYRCGEYSDIKDRPRGRFMSRSPSPLKSKKASGFDMAPQGAPLTAATTFSDQSSNVTQCGTETIPNMFAFTTSQIGNTSLLPAQVMTQQATRHARRVYVGGLPPLANEQTIATYFSQVMSAIGGNAPGPGDAVVNVYINREKKFAFLEMRTVEEASNAMALDGIIFEGVSVRVRRPTDYNPSLAALLGPSHPNPRLNLSAIGLNLSAISGVEGPDRIFIGGVPYYLTDTQVKELLESFGPLRGFDLVKDRDTLNSKGYGFCVYQDPSITDIACASLNGMKLGDKTLTVRRATVSGIQSKLEQELILQQAQQQIAVQKMVLQAGEPQLSGSSLPEGTATSPTKVICLTEVVKVEELQDDREYMEILEDMKEESLKFGTLVNVIIPRPMSEGQQVPGVGKVFLEYADVMDSIRAKDALHGRKFGGNTVLAAYYPEDTFRNGDYGMSY